MARIVRSYYRYKRPPRKRAKAAAIEGPAIVTVDRKTRVAKAEQTEASSVGSEAASSSGRQKQLREQSEPPKRRVVPKADQALSDNTKTGRATVTPANDDAKSAIVTARRPGKRRHADVPEMTEEEHRALGDRADAMMQEFKRQIAEKLRS